MPKPISALRNERLFALLRMVGLPLIALSCAAPTAHAATLSISANPVSVTSGAPSTITWSGSNATSCAASGAWSGIKAISGSRSVIAGNGLNIYTLNCSGPSGSASNSVVIGAGTPPPSLYSLNVTLSGSGTVTSNPGGIACGATCGASYPGGAAVTLSAAPATGFTFTGWSGDCSGSTPSCATAMSANRAVTATFSATSVPPPTGTLVTSANLLYLGVINIAHNDGNCADTPNARGTGLTYNPSGNNGAGSFYITGRLSTHCIAEITKPAVGGTATFIQGYRDPTNGTAAGVPGGSNGAFIGGHLLHNGSLYVTAFTYYDAAVEQNVAIWKRSPTLTDNTGLTGPSAAGPGNQGMYNQYMDNVPASFQSMLGGPAVIGGCCFSIISRTSLGPALYSFNPESLGTVTALVGYPDGNQTLNPWGAAGSHPEANPTTKMGGVTFVEGSDTVLFVGTTGKGEYCYGTSCTDPNYPGVQGAHAYPYVHYMWAYDIKELAKVKSGAKKMWEVFPYAHWELPDMGSVGADEWSATGIAFDSSTSYLYVLKSREPGGAAWPQIHVYRVTGL